MATPELNPIPRPQPRTTGEFRLDEQARGSGRPYLRYRDGPELRVLALAPALSPVYVGRHEGCAARLEQDQRVSRRHARLVYGAGSWSVEDAGSRNGTYLRGRPLSGESLLVGGDLVTVGDTPIEFCEAASALELPTAAGEQLPLLSPTPTQRRVLAELARPWFERGVEVPVAPTNSEIATRLGYETSTIRDAISALYRQAGLARGAVSQRESLVRIAIAEGIVRQEDLA